MDNLLLVFPHNVKNIEEWNNIINKFDEKNYFVYILNDISTVDFDIAYLPNIIEYHKNLHKNINKIVIMSNARDLILSWYRCYNSIADDFIYFIDRDENNFFIPNDEHSAFYYNLYEFNEIYSETIKGKIYFNKKDEKVLPAYYNEKYFDFFSNFDFFNKREKKLLNKKYVFNNLEYNFISNKEYRWDNIINLDTLQIADKYIKLIKYYSNHEDIFIKYYNSALIELNKIKKDITKLNNFEKNILNLKMNNELYMETNNDKYKIFLSSALLDIFNNEIDLELLLNLLIKSKEINKYNRFFAYYQCIRYIFLNKNANTENILNMRNELYNKLFHEFLPQNHNYERIVKEYRDNDLVFVFSGQILGINHAPTKVALDICCNLIKKLNKKVVLINTEEVLTLKGIVPMQNICAGNVINEYSNINTIKYKNVNIPFYQPNVLMPNDREIINILNMVKKYKPSFIINIGTVLVGDLCGEIVPTVTIPQGNDGYSKSLFYVVNDEKQKKEYGEKFNRISESLITSKFQFELKDKRNTFTKKQLGIPENKFIISVIGNRLNNEIDEEFLDLLDKSCKYSNAYVVFIDEFQFSQLQISNYKDLANNYKNMGYQQDLLAILENTDIYLNPNRSGGGTSAIYSLYVGKPVLTLKYGDVAGNVGEEFCVNNYEEMLLQIDKYYKDIEFYNKQSYIAKKRARELTDMETFITNVCNQVIKSNLYY